MRAASCRRVGLTRIELLVIAALLLTGVGLVMTVVVRSREPAHRLECAMHLKRIGEAVHAYHGTHKALPPSCIAPGYATWAVLLGPYLAQNHGAGLKAWDLTRPYYDQAAAVRDTQVWVYFCPSRRQPPQHSTEGDVPRAVPGRSEHVRGALGDYACAAADGNPTYPWTTPQANGAIVPALVLERKDGQILKWQAQTTLDKPPDDRPVSSKAPGKYLERGWRYTILIGDKHVPTDGVGRAAQGDGSVYNGDYPASFARVAGAGHALAQTPADPLNDNFGSHHPGVCQFLMADVSVRPFATTVPPELLGRLIVRNDPTAEVPE